MHTAPRFQNNLFWKRILPIAQPRPLHVEAYGSPGTNLVFLPGLGGTTRYWHGHLGSLEKANHTVLVDLLGFGESPKPWTRYTVDNHIEALHLALEKYAPFVLVGHSMGALLSLAYAARYPESVNALALLSLPSYESREVAMHTVRDSSPFYRMFFSNVVLAAIICVITRRVFAWLAPYIQPDLPREVARDIVKHSWRSFSSSLWEVIYKYNLRPDADAVGDQKPVLCIHGDRDPIAPLEGVQRLAKGRARWQVRVLPGVDHHPLFHAPVPTLQAIESILVKDRVA